MSCLVDVVLVLVAAAEVEEGGAHQFALLLLPGPLLPSSIGCLSLPLLYVTRLISVEHNESAKRVNVFPISGLKYVFPSSGLSDS